MKIISHSVLKNMFAFFKRRPMLLIPFMVFALAIGGCASAPAPASAAAGNLPAETQAPNLSTDAMAAQFHVLAGELAAQRGMTQAAVRHYVAALQYTSNKTLARRATRIALFAGDPQAAYVAASEWERLAPDSPEAQKTAARLALIAGDDEALLGFARGVVNSAASRTDGYLLLADLFSGRPKRAEMAVSTLSQLAGADDDSAAAWYALGLVALRYDRIDVAAQAAQHAIALAPTWDQAVLLRAATSIRQGQAERARKLVAALPGSAAQRSGYHMALAQLLLESDQLPAALGEFERALKLQPNSTAARYGLAMLALNLGDTERAAKAFRQLYGNDKRADQAAYYLGMINARNEAWAAAEKWYRRVNTGAHVFDARVRAALVHARQGDVSAARAELQDLHGRYPEMAGRLYAAEGRMLFVAKRYPDALAVYNDALQALPETPDLLYGRSIVLEKTGDIQAALDDLHHILQLKPDSSRAMNALGYLLTNHGTKYEEALGYITKALAADPDNPAILDSMGWVQYRLGHLDAALDYLQRAYEALPEAEIAAHLGEVLWQSGQHGQAREIWRKALSKDADHTLLRSTIDRLTSE